MLEAIASPAGFIALLAFFGLGMLGSLVLNKRNTLANVWGNGCAVIGAVWGLLFAASVFITGQTIITVLPLNIFTFFTVSLYIDKLAAFFIAIISLVTLFCSMYGVVYVREYYRRYNIGVLGFLYNLFIMGMLLVVTASNGLWFLLAWEVMSLASYFLVVYDRDNEQNVKAGYVYLVMTHVGALCILLAFAVLFAYTGTFEFAGIAANLSAVPQLALAAATGLFVVGLGTKAGMIPLHIWLPSAHPVAPSHVSALMSGVMIKTGIYMMIRLFLDILQPMPVAWGVVVLVIGAVSSVLGVLYALTAHDIKRLLAYHSIENIGIILLGLGSAMVFAAQNRPWLETLALCATLFHTLNHATFKSLLFLGAGSVIQAAHTRNIEKYGGLLKLMPVTGLLFLVGAMAISALPPLNGFFSEWLTYQSLLVGLASGDALAWVFLFAGLALALTGGLALACFVKVFGITFLARPRSNAAAVAKESSPIMLIGMAGLALACVLLGVLSGPVIAQLQTIAQTITHSTNTVTATAAGITINTFGDNATVSGILLAVILVCAMLGLWLVVRFVINRRQKVRVAPTWDCGTILNGRMEITATGFARSILLMFKRFVRPRLEQKTSKNGHRSVVMNTLDVYQSYIYTPLYAGLLSVSRQVKRMQNGSINTYILYIFGALLMALAIGVL